MSKIKEIKVEPSEIFTGSTFKLKIKVVIDKYLISENDKQLITEDGKKIITEWSE